jgi:hypothetical protein
MVEPTPRQLAFDLWVAYFAGTEEFDRSLPHTVDGEGLARVMPEFSGESLTYAAQLASLIRRVLGVLHITETARRAALAAAADEHERRQRSGMRERRAALKR